jgi:TrmH family RNA methyltransferase
MKFEDLRKLHQKKYRDELGYFLVEGEHLVLELQKAAKNDARLSGSEIYVTFEFGQWNSPFPVHVINARHMAQISETRAPQGIVAVVPMFGPLPPRVGERAGERAVCLHEIQDPGNLGTILRTLAWFGNFRCLLTPGSVEPFNAKVIRASMGAVFHVPVETDVPLASLTARYPRIACLDTRGTPITAASFRDHDCYLFGSEAHGLPNAEAGAPAAALFTIPGSGLIESLNVAAAVNLCAYELTRAR